MKFIPAALLAAFATAVPAQSPPTDYTTPEGAAFIHQQIKDQIISFKPDGDTDFIYFTAILGWRCGMRELFYGVNGGLAVIQFPLEPCYRDLRSPNTFDGTNTWPFFITAPTGSVQSITLRAVYDDGSSATFVSERAKNLVR
jgi:hypothetical protein